MGTTPRFGFTTFGPRQGGSITDAYGKFSDQDRVVLDSILQAFEAHTHDDPNGGQRLADPAAAPGAALTPSGGSIPGGKTYYYAVSFIDRYGLETAASPHVAVVAPAPLTPPPSPSLLAAAGGGTLTPGLYYYGLSYISATGGETPMSAPGVVTLLPGDGSVSIALPPLPPGAASFRVWRQPPNVNGFTRVATPGDIGTFVDDGSIPNDPCPCDPANLPPFSNLTSATNQVTVILSTADAALVQDPLAGIQGWRLYRTEVAGSWNGQALVHEVVETETATPGSPLVTEWTDTGGALLGGSPPESTQALAASTPFSLPTATVLPATAPDGFIIGVGGTLYVRHSGVWRQQVPAYGAAETLPAASSVPSGTTVLKAGVANVSNGTTWTPVSTGGGGGGGTGVDLDDLKLSSWTASGDGGYFMMGPTAIGNFLSSGSATIGTPGVCFGVNASGGMIMPSKGQLMMRIVIGMDTSLASAGDMVGLMGDPPTFLGAGDLVPMYTHEVTSMPTSVAANEVLSRELLVPPAVKVLFVMVTVTYTQKETTPSPTWKAPLIGTPLPGTGQIDLAWSAADGDVYATDEYAIEVKDSTGTPTLYPITGDSGSESFTGLAAGEYFLRVVAGSAWAYTDLWSVQNLGRVTVS